MSTVDSIINLYDEYVSNKLSSQLKKSENRFKTNLPKSEFEDLKSHLKVTAFQILKSENEGLKLSDTKAYYYSAFNNQVLRFVHSNLNDRARIIYLSQFDKLDELDGMRVVDDCELELEELVKAVSQILTVREKAVYLLYRTQTNLNDIAVNQSITVNNVKQIIYRVKNKIMNWLVKNDYIIKREIKNYGKKDTFNRFTPRNI